MRRWPRFPPSSDSDTRKRPHERLGNKPRRLKDQTDGSRQRAGFTVVVLALFGAAERRSKGQKVKSASALSLHTPAKDAAAAA